MTNEEKFRAGTVVYKDDDGDYVCELWEASTRHPDVVYHMNADGKYKKSGFSNKILITNALKPLICWGGVFLDFAFCYIECRKTTHF